MCLLEKNKEMHNYFSLFIAVKYEILTSSWLKSLNSLTNSQDAEIEKGPIFRV